MFRWLRWACWESGSPEPLMGCGNPQKSGSGEPRSQQTKVSADELFRPRGRAPWPISGTPRRRPASRSASCRAHQRMPAHGCLPVRTAARRPALHEGRRCSVTDKAEQHCAAQDPEPGLPQEIVEARAVGHHAIARRAWPRAVAQHTDDLSYSMRLLARSFPTPLSQGPWQSSR